MIYEENKFIKNTKKTNFNITYIPCIHIQNNNNI